MKKTPKEVFAVIEKSGQISRTGYRSGYKERVYSDLTSAKRGLSHARQSSLSIAKYTFSEIVFDGTLRDLKLQKTKIKKSISSLKKKISNTSRHELVREYINELEEFEDKLKNVEIQIEKYADSE